MIAVADLLKDSPRLPGNLFAHDAYVQGDIELGLLENRQGSRLLALPEALIEALYAGLNDEVGPSAGLVLFQCGYQWGKAFYRRFAAEVSDYYGQPLAQMETLEFVQAFQQCWKTYGWGTIELNFDRYEQGFFIATVKNSAFAQVRQSADRPQCFVEAGLLSAFFSQLTGQTLHAIQTSCESMGADSNHFILGLSERVKVAEAWLDEKQDHDTILQRLCPNQPVPSEPFSKPTTRQIVSDESKTESEIESINETSSSELIPSEIVSEKPISEMVPEEPISESISEMVSEAPMVKWFLKSPSVSP